MYAISFILAVEFSFKNTLRDAQIESNNDDYTRRTQLTAE